MTENHNVVDFKLSELNNSFNIMANKYGICEEMIDILEDAINRISILKLQKDNKLICEKNGHKYHSVFQQYESYKECNICGNTVDM